MIGDSVASKRSTVSFTAASYIAFNAGLSLRERAIASMSGSGLGMLPIGSVGSIVRVSLIIPVLVRRRDARLDAEQSPYLHVVYKLRAYIDAQSAQFGTWPGKLRD
jgi:hypothetical protein